MTLKRISGLMLACLIPAASVAQESATGGEFSGDWSGGYMGLQVGAIGADQIVNNVANTGVVGRSWSTDPEGVQRGLYLGYNWHYGSALVYGVEGEVNWSGADGRAVQRRALTNAGGNFTGTLTEVVDTRILGTAALRGRIGYALDNTLIYAAAGLAWVKHEGVYQADVRGVRSRPRAWSGTERGWTVGVGVEHAFDEHWIGRIDYRYSDFGQFDYLNLSRTNRLAGDLDTHEIRVGIAMLF